MMHRFLSTLLVCIATSKVGGEDGKMDPRPATATPSYEPSPEPTPQTPVHIKDLRVLFIGYDKK